MNNSFTHPLTSRILKLMSQSKKSAANHKAGAGGRDAAWLLGYNTFSEDNHNTKRVWKSFIKNRILKAIRKKETIYLFVYYFEGLSQMLHQWFGWLPINWAGGVRRESSSDSSFHLLYFKLSFINSTSAYCVAGTCKTSCQVLWLI